MECGLNGKDKREKFFLIKNFLRSIPFLHCLDVFEFQLTQNDVQLKFNLKSKPGKLKISFITRILFEKKNINIFQFIKILRIVY